MKNSVTSVVLIGVLAMGFSGVASAITVRDENPRFIFETFVPPPPPTKNVVGVPEPGTLSLLGLGALAVRLRKRRR